ncbi:MAG: hypothetical protein LBP35_01080 [Candidatus Ancillula trichonymphae]|jgi:hypothetical protein|nr:hypothetical protein [Candidatus Ancillula trichonymphae]
MRSHADSSGGSVPADSAHAVPWKFLPQWNGAGQPQVIQFSELFGLCYQDFFYAEHADNCKFPQRNQELKSTAETKR